MRYRVMKLSNHALSMLHMGSFRMQGVSLNYDSNLLKKFRLIQEKFIKIILSIADLQKEIVYSFESVLESTLVNLERTENKFMTKFQNLSKYIHCVINEI